MRALGLDLKPARSGIAMNYDSVTGGPRWSTVGVGAGKLAPLHLQIRHLERAVLARINNVGADVAFIEATFTKGRGSDYGQHAAHFAVTHLLWSKGIPWVDVQTGQLKMFATGSGSQRGATKVTKDKVLEAVIATYGHLLHIDPDDDDAADATVLVMMAHAAYGRPVVDLPRTHTRALEKLRGTLPRL